MKIYGPALAEGSEITNLTVKTGTSDPGTPNAGELFFRTDLKQLRVYTGTQWQNIGPPDMAIFEFTATADQTTFTGNDIHSNTLAYTADNVMVFLNGTRLDGSDYTATNGTSVILGDGAAAGDTLSVLSFNGLSFADVYTKTEADAQYAPITRGRKNLLINGDGRAWQRGSPINVSAGVVTYTTDRWAVYPVGDVVTVTSSSSTPRSSIRFSAGGSSMTALHAVQKIEAKDCARLVGKVVTLSFVQWANSSAPFTTVTVRIRTPTSGVDNDWTSQTPATHETYAHTFTLNAETELTHTFNALPSTAVNGVEVGLIYGGLTAGSIGFGQVQLEVGTEKTDFEFVPFADELTRCQRYYERIDLANFGINFSAYAVGCYQAFPLTFTQHKRVTPTLTTNNNGTGGGMNSPSFSTPTRSTVRLLAQSTQITTNAYWTFASGDYLAADAEIY